MLNQQDMEIVHVPLMDPAKAAAHYSAKRGVEVKYLCTSELDKDDRVCDIFYINDEGTPINKRYFGIFKQFGALAVCDASIVEDLEFVMVWDRMTKKWHYSRSKSDKVKTTSCELSGGRRFPKHKGEKLIQRARMKVTNGEFVSVHV